MQRDQSPRPQPLQKNRLFRVCSSDAAADPHDAAARDAATEDVAVDFGESGREL